MLDSIINLVKDEALKAITNNSNVPADKKEAAVEATASSILDGLKDQFTPDNLSGILNLADGGAGDSSSLTSSLEKFVTSSLTEKVGLSPSIAGSIASTVIPAVVGLISKKHNDSNDSFDIESLVKSFTGNKGGILGAISSFFGK